MASARVDLRRERIVGDTGPGIARRTRGRTSLAKSSALASMTLAVCACVAACPVEAATCKATSGLRTGVLVELFTSEGCDSCPPAERWLSTRFAPQPSTGRGDAIALAFHVDYWDRLGWRDRFASARATSRQQAAMRANGATFVYTPQVLLQGRDAAWRGSDFERRLASAAAMPARASLVLEIETRANAVHAHVTGEVASPTDARDARLVVAWVENGLVSQVTSGENAGARLVHDHVVRAWLEGPRPGDARSDAGSDSASEARTAAAPGGGSSKPARDGPLVLDHAFARPGERGSAPAIVAFVETMRTGEVLQAVSLPLCEGGVR